MCIRDRTDVEELAANAGVPVWNGLTTEWHPTQMLADVLTMQENFNYDLKMCIRDSYFACLQVSRYYGTRRAFQKAPASMRYTERHGYHANIR